MGERGKKKNIVELTRMSVEEYRAMGKLPIILIADSVRSLHNIGSFFRTADAFRLKEIILCGISGIPPHPELHKTALGAEESVEWRYEKDIISVIRKLRENGWKICVLEQVHGSVSLENFIPSAEEKYAIVAGNEVEGVSAGAVELADTVLEIPQAGTKHSLNVSVSAGIALWHFYSAFLPLLEK